MTAAACLAATVGVAGCDSADTSNGKDSPASNPEVTIAVGDLPTSDNESGRAYFLDMVAQFEADNPGIKIDPQETVWDAQTFAAQLAAHTLPATMTVPFTETRSLIGRGQLYDITDLVKDDNVFNALDAKALQAAADESGHYYGVPTDLFALGVLINRPVFQEAGLDPDGPLTTWDDVSAAMKSITEKTDAAGMGLLSTNNLGGWILTAMTTAFGGEMETLDGDTAVANVDNDGAKAALQWIHDNNDSMSANALLDHDTGMTDLAAGNVGMVIGANWYGTLVTGKSMNPEDLGMFAMPQAPGGLGALGGGSVSIIPADVTEEEAAAAIKWIEFYSLGQYFDLDGAKERAKADAADGQAVPTLRLPMVNAEQNAAYLDAVAEYTNVPLDNFASLLDSSLAVINEPPVEAQQIYALLDPVVQAVRTDPNADIDQLLADAQAQAVDALELAQNG
jgi:ABC-type glycerol-3-phosphate transport system substrate-binding protein